MTIEELREQILAQAPFIISAISFIECIEQGGESYFDEDQKEKYDAMLEAANQLEAYERSKFQAEAARQCL